MINNPDIKFSYKDAGVDTHKAASSISTLKDIIRKTYSAPTNGTVGGEFGSFAGVFIPEEKFYQSRHRLVAATDGVGTKIELAKEFGYYAGLGYDLVAMSVNDLLCNGARPAFFLDYVSCGKLDNSWYIPVVESIANACTLARTALIGGETAEHPGVMKEDDLDLAGFCVGFLEDKKALPRKENIKDGTLIYGIPSSGLHSNGFSLVRKIFSHIREKNLEDRAMVENPEWMISHVLTPTRIYTDLADALDRIRVDALVHITGGGYYENIPRVLPDDVAVTLNFSGVPELPVYALLKKYVNPREMYSTFNMGIGLVGFVSPQEETSIRQFLPEAIPIGRVIRKDPGTPERVFIKGIDFP